jgi:hypothetical protein
VTTAAADVERAMWRHSRVEARDAVAGRLATLTASVSVRKDVIL